MKSAAFLLAKLLKTDVYGLALANEGEIEGLLFGGRAVFEGTYSFASIRYGLQSNRWSEVAAVGQYRYSYRYGVVYHLRVLLSPDDASALSALASQFPFTA